MGLREERGADKGMDERERKRVRYMLNGIGPNNLDMVCFPAKYYVHLSATVSNSV